MRMVECYKECAPVYVCVCAVPHCNVNDAGDESCDMSTVVAKNTCTASSVRDAGLRS